MVRLVFTACISAACAVFVDTTVNLIDDSAAMNPTKHSHTSSPGGRLVHKKDRESLSTVKVSPPS